MTAPDSITSAEPSSRMRDRIELSIAVILGIASIGIAYASFQAALYDSQMAGAYQKGGNLATEAESLYLEGNQQYVQDAQLWNRLTELAIATESSDPANAADAQNTYEVLSFQAVSDDLSAAIDWAAAQNEADASTYYSPLDSEDYQAALFGEYGELKVKSEQVITEGDSYNSLSDQLTLYTVMMSISLFLLGIAAVVRQPRIQIILASTGVVIFGVSMTLTAFVPFVGL